MVPILANDFEEVGKESKNVGEVTEASGVSRRTVYKWLTRYRAEGQDALYDRSSRPRRSPRGMPVKKVATMAAMRRAGISKFF